MWPTMALQGCSSLTTRHLPRQGLGTGKPSPVVPRDAVPHRSVRVLPGAPRAGRARRAQRRG